ncbi:MAG: hypothetical protein GXP37_11630 [Chloroflexi bacterium]|nr:hypothetical protein [Chloroflexota bacterium]
MIALIRDIAIIFLAIESIVIGVLLVLLLWQVRSLVLLLRDEVGPVIQSTQETADSVRTTTRFVGQRIVKPGVNALSFAAGLRQAARTLKQTTSARINTPAPASQPTDSSPTEEQHD